MAVFAAHLTRTLEEKPSLFEVTAQESLSTTVKPALRKLIEFIQACNPSKFSWLLRWFDEIYLLLNGVLQLHYLKYYAASFAESFYGLQRVSVHTQEFTDGFHLSPALEKKSLFFLTLFPYMRQKFDNLAEKYRLDDEDGLIAKNFMGYCKKTLIAAHSTFHFALEAALLIQYLVYMAGRAASHSPLLSLSSVTLRHAPNIDYNTDYSWTDFWSHLKKGNFSSMSLTFPMVGASVLRGMELGAFFMQFLRWWHVEGPAESSSAPLLQAAPLDMRATEYSNKCPICLQHWRIATALPSSGYSISDTCLQNMSSDEMPFVDFVRQLQRAKDTYRHIIMFTYVFCYKCISRHLRDVKQCPVTKYPAQEEDLIRMYLD